MKPPVTRDDGTTVRERSLGAFAVAVAAMWTVAAGYAFHGSMPLNVVHLPLEKELATTVWAPEGWKFFTRNPREDRAFFFQIGPTGRVTSADLGHLGERRYLFGWDRRPRTQGVEYALLAPHIPSSAFQRCEGTIEDCLANATTAVVVDNPSPRPSLCGTIGIAMRPPVPWVWAHGGSYPTMPTRFVRVEVKC